MLGERTAVKDALVVAGFMAILAMGRMLQGFQKRIRSLIAQITEG